MNAKYFAALVTVVLATGLNQPITHAQSPQVVLTSFSNVLVQPYALKSSQPMNSEPSQPPVDGAPDERTPAGTHAAPLLQQPEAPP